MAPLSSSVLDSLWHDADLREARLRDVVAERLACCPAPSLEDQVVATYFFALRTLRLVELGREIAYHATSGIKNPPKDSLLAECTGQTVGIDAWDGSGRIGLLHMAYPLKMLLNEAGALSSCDLLHTSAGAIIFDVFENQDARLLWLTLPERVIHTFPGPAYGASGIREATNLPTDQLAFGTILKPTAGITPTEVGALVQEIAACPLFVFAKEDENLYPRVPYSPVKERTRQAVAAVNKNRDNRNGRGFLYVPHVTGSPHEILDSVHQALEAGASGVMFSESFANGTVRMVREATRKLERPPAIYGHNGGIGVRTRCIWRDVIDYLARLDGIDFRQTAPVLPDRPFIRPYGAEWEASERILTMPVPGIKPVMIARAGGLDQGNIILNLQDAERRGLASGILFLAGSAINSIKGPEGKVDPRYAAEGLQQAIEIHRSGVLRDVPAREHLTALLAIVAEKRYVALADAIRQRYPAA
jgi:ribulose 1,5-bisphosphate carboxylase large subunit-like protein